MTKPIDRKEKIILCPRCQQPSSLAMRNPYRPFCSERCKLIDLGQWASEAYKIPAEDQSTIGEQNIGQDDQSS